MPIFKTYRRLCLLAIGLLAIGCAKRAGVIFEPLPTPITWPGAPEKARIRYVGQLATSADLKPAVSLPEAMGQALFGKKPSRSMLTPFAACTDDADRLFVADSNAQLVHVFNLQTRKYGQLVPTNAEERFSQPVGIAWDPAGRLFVSDSVAAVVYVFDGNGTQIARWGEGTLERPTGIAVDANSGRVFVADAGAHRVVVLDTQGNVTHRVGARGTGLGEFNFPTAVAVDSHGRLYVSDTLNFRVQQFDADLKPMRQIGTKGDLPGYFGQPKGIAVDRDDHLYVVDAAFEAVQIFDTQGRLLLAFGQEGRNPGEFWLPTHLWIDAHNRIWVADSYNRRVQVFDYVPEGQP